MSLLKKLISAKKSMFDSEVSSLAIPQKHGCIGRVHGCLQPVVEVGQVDAESRPRRRWQEARGRRDGNFSGLNFFLGELVSEGMETSFGSAYKKSSKYIFILASCHVSGAAYKKKKIEVYNNFTSRITGRILNV